MNIKKILNPIIYFAAGLFSLIFLALNYFSMNLSAGSYEQSRELATGYQYAFFSDKALLSLFLEDDGTKMSIFAYIAAIALILVFVAAIALLIFGALGIYEGATDKKLVSSFDMEKISKLLGTLLAALSIIALALTLVFGLANGESEGGASVSYLPAIGAWLLTIVAVAQLVATKIIGKKEIAA